jgi:hypothetical protein
MQANAMLLNLSAIVANMLGVLAALLVLAVLTGFRAPLIANDRAAFFALAIVGFTMCAVGGIGATQATLGWTHPITLVGIVLGIVATLLIAAVLTGQTAVLQPARPTHLRAVGRGGLGRAAGLPGAGRRDASQVGAGVRPTAAALAV